MAGDEVLGSLSRLEQEQRDKHPHCPNDTFVAITREMVTLPLNTGQDGCHIICRAPSVLENIKAQLAGTVDVGVEHLANELHPGRLIGVLFLEVHHQAEGSIFEGRISGADDDGIPSESLVDCTADGG